MFLQPGKLIWVCGERKSKKQLCETLKIISVASVLQFNVANLSLWFLSAKKKISFIMQALEGVQIKQEVTQIEEERIQVLNNIEELEQKIKDVDNQMEESVREVT